MAPVHDAAWANDVEVLRRLLVDGVSLDEEDDWWLWTPLHHASCAGSMEAACMLLDAGADIDGRESRQGTTPLMQACLFGETGMASLLLSRGADPAPRCHALRTALICATGRGRTEVIRLLLEDGRVQVDACDGQGRTALWHACNRGSKTDASMLLVEGRADHTVACVEGETPMDVARRRFRGPCVRLLEVRVN